MAKQSIRETDLYAPVKALLEEQGYEVKGEIGVVDVAGYRSDEPPVIVELKTSFSLALFHQAAERQRITDTVYVAVPHKPGKAFATSLKRNTDLCRRLGLGLLTVRLKDGSVYLHLDPAPYKPRQSKAKQARLLLEFTRRVGDPNEGGSTRRKMMTAYRQDALRCLGYLCANGPTKAAQVAGETDVERARRIMADDHYGWFERAGRGIYAITPKGKEAMGEYSSELKKLAA